MASRPEVSVVVPTLEEAGNVGALVRRLDAALEEVAHEIVVVDDDSTDGTRAEARSASPIVRVVHRTESSGLSSAVVRGFEEAEGEYVCVMDGDLQHPPEAVVDLLEAARWDDADLVVGSRYREEGDVVGFPASRRFVSWGARRLTQLVSPTVRDKGLTDPVSGFFLVRRERLDLDAIQPRGYKILLEVLHRCPVERVREVGFTFRSRRSGDSNLSAAVAWALLRQLASLGWADRENRRVVQFGLVGLTGTLVNLAVLSALTELGGLHYLVSAALAIEVSILWNFAGNDAWTFRDRRPGSWLNRLWRFNLVSVASMGVNLSVLAALTEGLGVHYLASEIVAILVAFAANYAGNLSWTYLTVPSEEPDEQPDPLWVRGVHRVRASVQSSHRAESPGKTDGRDDEIP